MPRKQQGGNDRTARHEEGQPPADGQPTAQGQPTAPPEGGRGRRFSAWFASATVRLGVGIIGFVLLLFALGQAFGVDLLGLFADALESETGRWLVVAFFALLLIAAAQKGLRRTFRRA